eukprot:11169087-Lingulodinium_polyedra.AAC.1
MSRSTSEKYVDAVARFVAELEAGSAQPEDAMQRVRELAARAPKRVISIIAIITAISITVIVIVAIIRHCLRS